MPTGDRRASPAAPHPGRRLAAMLLPRQRLLTVSSLATGRRVPTEAAMRALAGAVPMAGGLLLCRALGRYKMLVDDADLGHAPHLVLDGFWEWWTTAFLARHLRPGERVVDVGACYGYFSLLAADCVGPEGKVLALEPHPRQALLLRRNLGLNGFGDRVALEQAALVAEDAPRPLRLASTAEDPAGARLLAPGESPPVGHAVFEVPGHPAAALADFRPSLVKLDAAQMEEPLWPAFDAMLAADRALRILLAFHPDRCADPAALLDRIGRRVTLRRLDPDGGVAATGAAELLAGGDAMLYLSAAAPG